MPCSGQVTRRSKTMPCDSGPPLCGQRSSTAKISSTALRNSAMSISPLFTTREPSRGMSSSGQILSQSLIAFSFRFVVAEKPDRAEFPRLHAGSALGPWVLLDTQRIEQPRVERPAAGRILDDAPLDVVEADALHEMHRAVQVVRLLTVKLHEGAGVFEHLLLRPGLDQEFADLGLDAAVAGDVDFPAGIDADDADVLDRRLGAVPRTAGNGELGLVRRPHALESFFQADAQCGRVLHAETAPFRADAGLYRAQGFAIGMAGGHVEITPDIRQILLLYAEQADALSAGDLHRRHPVFLRLLGDTAQFGRSGDAAVHARYHRIAAVLLDVGVGALVDEARARVVMHLVRKSAHQVVVERRTAAWAAVRRLPFHEAHRFRNREQPVLADRTAHLFMRVFGATAHRFFRCVLWRVGAADDGRKDLLDQAGA